MLPPDSHQEFQELCALSTTGELTVEEWAQLSEHLSHCDSCREAKRLYERLIATTIPALGAESSTDEDSEDAPGVWSLEEAEAKLMESLRQEPALSGGHKISLVQSSRWKHVRRYAVAAVILAVCSVAGYRIGMHRGARADASAVPAGATAPSNKPELDPSVSATVPVHPDKAPPEWRSSTRTSPRPTRPA